MSEDQKNVPAKLKNVGTEKGLLKSNDLSEEYSLAQTFCKSGMLPKSFDTPEKVLTARQYAMELGLQPLTAMRQMAIINGTPSFYGDLPLALVKKSTELEYIKETIIDENGSEILLKNKNINAKPWGAVCIVKRKEEPNEVERTFTMDEAIKANLVNKDVWKNYPKTMLKYRARAMALKDCFPDILNGLSIAEYDHNDIPTDDNNVVVATSEEVQDHIDKTMTQHKIELMKAINDTFDKIKEVDPIFTEAKRIKFLNEYLQTTEMHFATEVNLEILRDKLTLQIDARLAKQNNEKKVNNDKAKK